MAFTHFGLKSVIDNFLLGTYELEEWTNRREHALANVISDQDSVSIQFKVRLRWHKPRKYRCFQEYDIDAFPRESRGGITTARTSTDDKDFGQCRGQLLFTQTSTVEYIENNKWQDSPVRGWSLIFQWDGHASASSPALLLRPRADNRLGWISKARFELSSRMWNPGVLQPVMAPLTGCFREGIQSTEAWWGSLVDPMACIHSITAYHVTESLQGIRKVLIVAVQDTTSHVYYRLRYYDPGCSLILISIWNPPEHHPLSNPQLVTLHLHWIPLQLQLLFNHNICLWLLTQFEMVIPFVIIIGIVWPLNRSLHPVTSTSLSSLLLEALSPTFNQEGTGINQVQLWQENL